MKFIFSVLILLGSCLTFGQSLESNLSSFFEQSVTGKGLVNYAEIDGRLFNTIISQIGAKDLENATKNEKVAFYVNAYNIAVIAGVIQRYDELKSVQEDGQFYKTPHLIANENIGLDDLEKRILKLYPGGDIHMVLNCGAVGCPPLTKTVYKAELLEDQLTKTVFAALTSDKVIEGKKISSIFKWYSGDFIPDVKTYITDHGGPKLGSLKYLDYDWSLNQANDDSNQENKPTRYYSSNLYGKGAYEVGVFNNYYSQYNSASDRREDFFTSTVTALFGINKRINVGLDLRLRGVQAGIDSALPPFGAASFPAKSSETDIEGNTIKTSNSALSAIGLRIKYQPWKRLQNLTFQHVLYIPTIGSSSTGFLDWESPYIISDAYYDKNLGAKSAIFISGGLHLENINSTLLGSGGGYSQASTPFTAIYSYFPSKKSTLYALANVAPKWGVSRSNDNDPANIGFDPFGQLGLGAKYFITDEFQVELLYTAFFDTVENRSANTYNVGVRYYGW